TSERRAVLSRSESTAKADRVYAGIFNANLNASSITIDQSIEESFSDQRQLPMCPSDASSSSRSWLGDASSRVYQWWNNEPTTDENTSERIPILRSSFSSSYSSSTSGYGGSVASPASSHNKDNPFQGWSDHRHDDQFNL
ncbi:MAG: hypothetical protein Q8P67_26800, partial [archaeon]|nr:hypothetical protein [archaeon]